MARISSEPVRHRARRWAIGTGIALSMVAGLGVVGSGPALAADDNSVIFLGDSVTAGFGYLGQKENAPNISGGVNSAFANSWYFGDNSLSDCNPPSSGNPDDRCSNNNFNGAPWSAGPWQAGASAPNVAYSFQIAASQNPAASVPVENWAVTGSTPEQWDPNGGPFGFQLKSIKDTHVVMTLGANPILASFLKIRVAGYPATTGVCADSTMWLGWTGWWAYPVSNVVQCADQQWAQNSQTAHLINIYKTLLQNDNKVLVMGYYRTCPWSFGVWQPNGNVASGPASGNSCPSQTEKVDAPGKPTISQWDQAVGASDAMNNKIADAVGTVQAWAKTQPGLSASDLQFTMPDQGAWAQHQAWSSNSWVFKNDTWIHPSKAGHAQLANTVTTAMCSSFGQWCGAQPSWDAQSPTPQAATVKQAIKGSVPATIKRKAVKDLPSFTKRKRPIGWTSSTPNRCRLFEGDLVARNKAGTCTISAYTARSGQHKPLNKSYTVTVK